MTKFAGVLLVVAALFLAGCSKAEKGNSGTETASTTQHETTPGAAHETMGGTGQMGAMKTTAKVTLPPGANKTCPVTGNPVDPAIHLTYKGKTVYFCCPKCPPQFKADPEKYFAKAYPDAGK